MEEKKYKIHPNIMLLQKQGQIFAGQLSEKIPPILIQDLDLILINSFCICDDIESALNYFFNNDYTQAIAAGISQVQVNQRIQQFIDGNLLVVTDASVKDKYQSLSSQSESKLKINFDESKEYLLEKNFALIPCVDGFKIWSARFDSYNHLSLEQAILLCAFGRNQSLGLVVERYNKLFTTESILSGLELFVSQGHLLEVKEASSVEEPLKVNQGLTKTQSEDIVSWKSLKADKRIPIYFVPHMENHYPLALGMLFSAIVEYQSGALLEDYQLVPITFLSPEEFLSGPYQKFGQGIWLFSNYMWSVDTNIQISQAIKAHDSGNITIHGGPSTPNYLAKTKAFFKKYESVDFTVHNEGEVAICEILKNIKSSRPLQINEAGMSEVSGITFKSRSSHAELIRTPDRVRLNSPDSIPSPYIEGYFSNYYGEVEAAIIESNRGCPFGCTFCDWGSATSQKVRKFDLTRVKKEIEWIAKQRVRVLWIADANFGMYDRDIELAEYIVEQKEKLGFPSEVVVNYTKNTTWRLAKIIEVFNDGGIISQGVISIQTTDVTTLEVINRKNIKTAKYDELSEVFNKQKLPLSTDLMIGLPGITVEAFKNDLQRYFDRDVSVKAYPTQLLPNSPMADPDYIEKYKIQTDEEGFLISTYSYTNEELVEMKELYKFFTIADGYSVLRYLLRYLQWDHGIKAIDFLSDLYRYVNSESTLHPRLRFCFRFFDVDKFMPGGWHLFFTEVKEYVVDKYGIELSSGMESILKVNEAMMPEQSKLYPIKIETPHDVGSYFIKNNNLNEQKTALTSFDVGTLKVEDLDGTANADLEKAQYDSHQFFWELHSPISRAKSTLSGV